MEEGGFKHLEWVGGKESASKWTAFRGGLIELKRDTVGELCSLGGLLGVEDQIAIG